MTETASSAADYQVMPPLSDEEYAALRADIRERGILVPVIKDQHGNIIDGHHRVQIADELGITCPAEVRDVTDEQARDTAYALNLARRHLTGEQRRQLIAKEIQASPRYSDRAIARRLGCDHKTVASVRRELRGEFPHPKTNPEEITERGIVLMTLDIAKRRHGAAQAPEEQRSWAWLLEQSEDLLRWADSGTPNTYWFTVLAQRFYLEPLTFNVRECLGVWLTAVASLVIEECDDLRYRRGDHTWRMRGVEKLAEYTIALFSPKISSELRMTMFDSMQERLAIALAESSDLLPIPGLTAA